MFIRAVLSGQRRTWVRGRFPRVNIKKMKIPKRRHCGSSREETGFAVNRPLSELGVVKQAGGKIVSAWCFEGDADPEYLVSNTFQMEWPPRSGRNGEFPEVDRGGWFSMAAAQERILKSQAPFIDMLDRLLNHQRHV